MNMIVQERIVTRGLNKLNIRKDSNLLQVLGDLNRTLIIAFFACPTGRMGDEQCRLVIEETGVIVEYTGGIEYINSFYFNRKFYHAFLLREQ